MKERQLQIQYINIDELKGWEKNPRINDDAAVKLAKLITEHGFIDPIIATPDGIIRAGHTRAKAAKIKGMEKVPVIYVDFESEKHAEAFSLADNKAGEWAEWDFKKLVEILLDMDAGDIDMEITGFNIDEIEDLVNEYGDEKVDEEENFDLEEELSGITDPISRTGDIWCLGDHRIICGDSTDPEIVKILMNGIDADMVFTDPPYNVDYESSSGMKLENDNMEDAPFKQFLLDSFTNMFDVTKMGGPIYICHADSEGLNFRAAMEEAGWNQTQTLIWVKNALVMGRQDYHWKHEPILYGWKPGAAHKWYGFRDKTTVFDDDLDIESLKKSELKEILIEILNNLNTTILRQDKPRKNDLHPTMKPLPLVRNYIKNSSRRKEIVLDLFAGSGSSVIAAEQLERICYGGELDPIYTDVIVRRYINFKGSTDGVRLLRDGKELHYSDIEEVKEEI